MPRADGQSVPALQSPSRPMRRSRSRRVNEAFMQEKRARKTTQAVASVAAEYLGLLASRGVDYLFGNAGTDFAPLVEAYAEAAQNGTPAPHPMLATHENLAVSMAHGYAMVSRRIPAVMVHVSVGTANMICAAMNAAREHVALLLTAGRYPLTRSEEHTAELQSLRHIVCRLL